MHDVDARAGPVGQRGGAVQRLDGDHVGARGQMRQRVVAPGRLHLVLPPEQDRRVLRMDRAAQADLGQDLEPLQHRAVRGARVVAGRVPQKQFRADHALLGHRAELVEIVLPQQAIEPEIHQRLFLGQRPFLARAHGAVGGRARCWGHVEDAGDPACGRRRRPPLPKSSFRVMPGSPGECTCTSMQPGQQVPPIQVEVPARPHGCSVPLPTCAIRPSRTPTHPSKTRVSVTTLAVFSAEGPNSYRIISIVCED